MPAHDDMLRSTWYGKTTEFSFPQDCGLVFPTWPKYVDPVKRAGPFLTLPTLVSHSFYFSWRWEGVGLFVGQKRWVHCILPFFTKNLHEVSSVSCRLSQISCKNSTINFERDKQLGKKGWRALGLSPTKPTANLSNRGGERGCDDTTINLTM